MVLHSMMMMMMTTRLTRKRGCSIKRWCLMGRIVFYSARGKRKKIGKSRQKLNYWLVAFASAAAASSFSIVVTDLKVSTDSQWAAQWVLIRRILFERSTFQILTATVINLSGITKLSNCWDHNGSLVAPDARWSDPGVPSAGLACSLLALPLLLMALGALTLRALALSLAPVEGVLTIVCALPARPITGSPSHSLLVPVHLERFKT